MKTLPFADDIMWSAVENRDASYDGKFFLGVRSTGIYCRPSCRSRQPLRRNVTFYASADAAEAAGYRPCKRCRPRLVSYSPQADQIASIRAYIEQHADERLTLEHLAAQFNLSPFHLQRSFKQVTGLTPRQYAHSVRLAALKTQVRQQPRITDAIYAAGFQSSSRAYDASQALGMTLAAYRAGGAEHVIAYDIQPTDIGLLLVAATQRGLCAVRIGDDEQSLIDALEAEFPNAQVNRQPAPVRQAMAAITEYLGGSPRPVEVPLDVQATAFQSRVWAALRAIPYGERRTYAQIAEAINQPGAARAVGNACASNPVALVIPCHRVVKGGGALGSYRWGTDRKRQLLETELKHAPAPRLGV
jgi:AraC family transcriptional regulator of adaptative response/methylated-DNA-[protein]-cysteine methyltransferase